MAEQSIFSDPFMQPPAGVGLDTGTTPQRPASIFSDPTEDQRLSATVSQARATPPDTAGRVLRLQQATGLPAGVIGRNLDTVEAQAARQSFDPSEFSRRSPALAAWLVANPMHAAVAQDDLPTLSLLERTLQVGTNSVRALGAGVAGGNAALWGTAQFGAEAMGLSGWGDYFKRLREQATRGADTARGEQDGAGDLEKAFYSGFESMGFTGTGLAMSVLSGNPEPMLALMGVETGGQAYGQARDQGIGRLQAATFGLSQGAVEVATEMIPAHLLIGDLSKRAGLVKTLMHQIASEVPGEQVATALQDLNEWATLNPEKPFSDYLAARPSAFMQTLVATVTMVGVQTSLATGLDRVTKSSTSQRVIEDLHKATEASKTRERAPEAFHSLVEQATEGGLEHVYAPVQQFSEYFQAKGEDPAAMAAQLTGNPDAYRLAMATDGDLAIPTSNYLSQVVGSGHEAFFAKELRLSPDQMNARETQEALTTAAADGSAPAEADQGADIHAELVSRLVETGRMAPATAERVATVISEAFPNIASRVAGPNAPGLDLEAIVAKWLPEVQGPSVAARPVPVATASGPAISSAPEMAPPVADASLDTVVPPAQTVPYASILTENRRTRLAGSLADSGVSASRPGSRENEPSRYIRRKAGESAASLDRRRQDAVTAARATRRTDHLDASFDYLAHHAQQLDPAVDPVALRREFDFRLAYWEEQAQTYADSGHDPLDLLREIASRGGINIEDASFPGEVRHLAEGQRFGAVQGVPGIFRQGGQSIEVLATSLAREDARFAWIENVDMLIDAVDDAVRHPIPEQHILIGTDEMGSTLGMVSGEAWWRDPWAGEPVADSTSADAVDTGGDASFNTSEFYQAQWHQDRLSRLVNDTVGQAVDAGRDAGPIGPDLASSLRAGTFDVASSPALADAAARLGVDHSPAGWQRYFEQGDQTFEQGARGSITFSNDGAAPIVKLFAASNRSTFFHETGHLFLGMMADLTEHLRTLDPDTLTESQQAFIADYQTALDAIGATADAPLTTEQHEQFARLFEAYLMEGKAPSVALRGVFRRVRSWLVAIYRNLQGLSRDAGHAVELTDEVRKVMDRLLATNDAIAEAQADAGGSSLFTSAAVADVPQAELDGYRAKVQAAGDDATERLHAKVMGDLAREETIWWKDERATVREEVAGEIEQQPVYRALAAMQKGTHPDGTPLEGGAVKLSKAAIVAQFGQDRLKALPRPYIYSAEGGVHPDVAAELFGFPSGQALLDAVTAAPKVGKAIDAETDARMVARHGDLVHDPAQLSEEARQAVADEHRDDVIRTELAMLNRLRNAAAPSVRAERQTQAAVRREGAARVRSEMPDRATLQRQAEAQIASMHLTDVRPDRFWASARKNSRLATQAAATQDYDTAVRAKQAELVNLALYREATAARDAVRQFTDDTKAFFRPDATLATRRAMDLVHAARLVASTFLYPDRRTDALEALDLVQRYDPDLYDSLQERIRSAMASGTNLNALTYDEFQQMRDTTMALWEMSLRTQQALINGRRVDRAEIADALQTRLAALSTPSERAGYARATTAWDQAKMYLLGFRAALRRTESWVDAMDGGNPDGVFRRYLWTPISDAAATYRIARRETVQAYLDLVQPIAHTLTKQQIHAPELVGPEGAYTFSGLAEVLGALQHYGNESNLTKFLVGRGWGALRADGTLDSSRFDAFKTRLERSGVLTREHYVFLQGLWNLFEAQKPAAQQAHHDMYGYYFNEITARPFTTAFGTFEGGYVPAMADPLLVPEANVRNEKTAVLEGGNSFMFPTTGRGFTKARVHYNVPLVMDLGLVPMQLDKVLKFIHLEPRVKDVARLVLDRSTRAALDAFDPAVGSEMLVPWLQRAATQRVSSSGSGWAVRGLNSFARMMRTRVGLNIMTANVVNTLQQFTGLSISAVQVKPRHLAGALFSYMRGPAAFAETVAEASTFMRTTITGQGLEIQQTIDDLLLNPTKYEKVKDFATRHGYFLSSATQNIVSLITWSGAYDQATEAGSSHADAVRQADSVVRETQGTFAPEDVSRFETGMPAVRAFTMFASYFNMQANLLGTEFVKVARDMGLRRGAGRGLYVYAMGFMIPAVLSEVIRQAVGGADDKKDDGEAWWLSEFLSVFFGSQARGVAAFVPGVGPAVTTALAGFDDQPFNDRLSTSPAISAIENSVHAPSEVYHAIEQGRVTKRAVQDTLTAIGLLTGVPVAPLGKPLGYAADVMTGHENPENALALARGLVTGRSQR